MDSVFFFFILIFFFFVWLWNFINLLGVQFTGREVFKRKAESTGLPVIHIPHGAMLDCTAAHLVPRPDPLGPESRLSASAECE